MKKLLIASTALSLAGGAAFAEMAITVGGSAELGLDYNSEPGEGMSKHSFVHDFGVTFGGSGTTDAGLSFSASAGFDNKSGGGSFDDGSVSVSGSFGTLSIGDVGRGIDLAGGIEDVGMNDIGVDDMVEDLREGTAKQIRYENNFGQISIAVSAGTKDGSAAVAGKDAVPARYAPEHTIPAVVTPAMDPTAWIVGNPDIMTHAFPVGYTRDKDGNVKLKDMPTISMPTGVDDGEGGTTTFDATAYDMLYGVTARVETDGSEAVSVDHDDDGDTDEINIYGYSKVGDTILDADGEDANEAGIAAFNKYFSGHDLGADMKVGGQNDGDDKNADTLMVDDNGVGEETLRPEQTVGGELIAEGTPAVEPVPAVASETQYAFGMKFDAGGVTIGVGYDSEKTVSMGASFSAGEVSTNLLYVKTDEEHPDGEATGIGADMTYTMGASAVTLAYGRNKPEGSEAMDAVGMGVTHDLGGGAELNAGFGKVNETNKASIGIKFAF